ncbi:MAG: aspartate--tRNA(Asn) ligase [Cenarchaeum sp. SB0665_bin_23]|nr:aspartate--tRNA(Asn) ligase [Cenarchaeum sp. SB0667_bin_13]MXY60756.1 aspartate--tRNA(Asn) ligase [Cenarchaeum sp. SB0665_bin_23]MXZ93678.1 aspartate--tRNA(Asn) ligase [Cenarchaeum sp. SB0666_bin_15]MYB47260.1 aspartate--tRNA(Asn) ligase [Cenarchaeum sp. SB0662_bin_33]MYC79335.1 aspartate--tRNA(Asn) ligase [Cenarchaeum sp. SB0661_bin_35]MYD58269.1 aspartate--tRNA(Asn) ligase [Cenarchaeum sp. SB0678_bin_8]MYG32671.1 aspartate--tRNA(Asn) ligase [Cenarchaeum sp. SB0677_bin_16]MYI51601.1 aspa
MVDELGKIRRTHLSSSLDPSLDGQRITVMGWVTAVRVHGSITFTTIQDRHGPIQIVAKRGVCADEARSILSALKPHSSISISGEVSKSDRAPGGIEIIPHEIRVFSAVTKTPPFEPAAISIKNIDTRLESRCIDLRREPLQHIFRARSSALSAVRNYFLDNDFTEINTPKIIASATEGGAALFSIFYYDKEAFLAQSPQLYKEQLTMSFERVFEIASIFRAEPSRTNRHLAEAISIDLEEAFVDYNDIMERVADIVMVAADAVRQYTGFKFEPPNTDSIPQYTYQELSERIKDAGSNMEWGDDLHPSWLRKIRLEGLYFIKDWPMGPKPFYVKTNAENPDISESFDLMYNDLELSSGSTRIQDRHTLKSNMQKKGMNVDSFEPHLNAFEYGMPPHAGCGIGLERLMMALTNTENIRDAVFYPRDVDRLGP